MAQFVSKASIETPVHNFRNFDLSCQQLTTQFFMRTGVVYAKEFPKCNIKLNLKTFLRMQPLLKPVMGSIQVHNRAFYVPFRTVWDPWNSFLTQAPYNNDSGTSIINAVPTIDVNTFTQLLVAHSTVTTSQSAGSYDFSVGSTNYVLDYKGRHYYKIMRQLGYGFFPNTAATNDFVSALPLLCYAKVFMDYYFPSQYAHTGTYAFIDGFFNRRNSYVFTLSEIELIFECCRCTFYGQDYFTAAWENPVSPVSGAYDSGVLIPDITNSAYNGYNNPANSSRVYIQSNGTPVVGSYNNSGTNGTQVVNFSQYIDDSLKAMTNYVKRHQLVGARVLDRYLADFGVQLDADKLRRCIYIGSQSFPIQFSDVMANSDTVNAGGTLGAQLGDYAGKGVAYDGQGNFEFSSDEYGYLIVINDITPDIAYYQGQDRNVMHVTPFQFYQPQFDGLGTQPIYQCEANVDGSYNALFGFTGRYAEYKVGRDSVTGLFDTPSKSTGLLGWSTQRSIPSSPVHSFNFMRGDDSWQYSRIFYGSVLKPEDELDKFLLVHRINIKAAVQMLPLFDTYEFDEPEGIDININPNGTQFK